MTFFPLILKNNMLPESILTKADAAKAYAQAWNKLECSHLEPLLDDGVHFASQNVFAEMTSKHEVCYYLEGKMATIRNSPKAKVFAELGETSQYPAYSFSPQPCVILAQGNKDNILAVVLFEVRENKITRIDICSVAPVPKSARRSGHYPM